MAQYVDLDGTLAFYDGWKGIEHIGAPIPRMLFRVRKWLEDGLTVKIFTARASVGEPERTAVIAHIHAWCRQHDLPELEVTATKGFDAVEVWDDRCVQVEPNTANAPTGGGGRMSSSVFTGLDYSIYRRRPRLHRLWRLIRGSRRLWRQLWHS